MRPEVHVWLARPADLDDAPLERVLSAPERAEIARCRAAGVRRERTIAWALLRLLAGAYLDRPPEHVRIERTCAVCGGAHGRPVIRALEVSLSHTPGLIALAFAGAPVGVDVEPLGGAPDAFRWTRLEALAKAIGTGLVVDPDAIEALAAAQCADWTIVHLRPTPRDVVAVATPGRGVRVVARSADRTMTAAARSDTLMRCAEQRRWRPGAR